MTANDQRHTHSVPSRRTRRGRIPAYAAAAASILLMQGCASEPAMVSPGIDDSYTVRRMQTLSLHPALTGEAYRWSLLEDDGSATQLADTRDLLFFSPTEGDFRLRLEIIDPNTPYVIETSVRVVHEDVEYSPYISSVLEYCPAPGQFVNEMPLYEEGDTEADMVRKAGESITGKNDVLVTLGGYGGYITFAFDHTVANIPGEKDFRIWGNCFYELLDPTRPGGSAEPGIVMVSYDTNCNGLPDDPWYELAGSEADAPETVHDYSITYRRPDPAHTPVADAANSITDLEYIPWTDSLGETGFIPRNMFHRQNYYPRWASADTLTFSGTLLAPNATDLYGDGSYYILYSYPWGYADNHPNDRTDLNSFDISDAVDAEGNPVSLPGADFIRVYTGVNQCCGRLGETSTEICRARDLHIQDSDEIIPDPGV